jgi:selenocysteine lyase/cysteine desulfurase
MLTNQKEEFRLPKNISYLNGAYMAPMLKRVEKIGHEAVSKKCFPYQITGDDFFDDTKKLKQEFATLATIDDAQNVAIIPSVSYGIATVANNINLTVADEIIVVSEQFPSNIYSWQKLADKNKAHLRIIKAPANFKNRGKRWNETILNAITDTTAVVSMPHVHWADGTLFDLKAIRAKTKLHNALLIIDGTQSVGALPFSVKEIQPDALICAGYKWLLGPYAIGLAYYADTFNNGNPIEENWINRKNSENFSGLVNYQPQYQPKAGRYNVGEMSNFILVPMLIKAIEQLNKWQPQHIQAYCKAISKEAIKEIKSLECFIEEEHYRASHLFGIYLPKHINLDKLKAAFSEQNTYVSFRGNAIRVSPNVYNTKEDFEKLITCFKSVL